MPLKIFGIRPDRHSGRHVIYRLNIQYQNDQNLCLSYHARSGRLTNHCTESVAVGFDLLMLCEHLTDLGKPLSSCDVPTIPAVNCLALDKDKNSEK